MLSHDCRFAVRSYGDDLDWNSEVAFHECDVLAEFCRKLLFRAAVGEVGVPALELSVYRLDVRECVERPLV